MTALDEVHDDLTGAESDVDIGSFNAHLGSDIRSLRKARGMTLSELATVLDRSVGYLSQLERGLSVPPVNDISRIAAVFDVPISWFLQHTQVPEHERGVVVRKQVRRRAGSLDSGLMEELLSPDIGGAFEMLLSSFAAGASSASTVKRNTEETAYMLSGTLEITVAGTTHTVRAGDSFSIRNENFSWHNPTNETARAVWTIAPPVY